MKTVNCSPTGDGTLMTDIISEVVFFSTDFGYITACVHVRACVSAV